MKGAAHLVAIAGHAVKAHEEEKERVSVDSFTCVELIRVRRLQRAWRAQKQLESVNLI